MKNQYVIDFGSRSVKLHQTTGGLVSLHSVHSWDPIVEGVSDNKVGGILDDLTRSVPDHAGILVVGTAAARRDEKVANAIYSACDRIGLSYETITQKREAELIRQAFGEVLGFDIINVGGGSIQVVHDGGDVSLIEFGISDLNKLFALDGPLEQRDVSGARALLQGALPHRLGQFVYSGGERAYLNALGAELDDEGMCSADEFLRVTTPLANMSVEQLEALSPFDAGWMRGAIASNLIVEAALEVSGADVFIASDLNIADGIIQALMGDQGDDANHRI